MTADDKHEMKAGFFVAIIACCMVALLAMSFAGCATSAPAAPAPEAPTVKTCGNPECTCTECFGDCKCGERPAKTPGAEYLELAKKLRDAEARAEKAEKEVARSRTKVDLATIDHEQKSKFEAEVNYRPYKKDGVWYHERDGITYRYAQTYKAVTEYQRSCNGGTCTMVPVTTWKPNGFCWQQSPERSVLTNPQPATKPQAFQPRGRTRLFR